MSESPAKVRTGGGDRHHALRGVMGALGRERGVLGATLITRDGLCVINNDEKILSPEIFSAMTAALMGAAETAFHELGGSKSLRVTAETASTRMVAVGASEDLLLVVVGNGVLSSAELSSRAEQAAQELRKLIEGG